MRRNFTQALKRFTSLTLALYLVSIGIRHEAHGQEGASVTIQVVDDSGAPIRNAQVYRAPLTDVSYRNSNSVRTDAKGRVTLTGLRVPEQYIVGVRHLAYGMEHLRVKTSDTTENRGEPKRNDQSDSRKIVLRKGKTIKGVAVCSDGKPPAGWRILALPTWWHYGASPGGQVIGQDGTFELPHIVEGKYDVSISVPSGERGSQRISVLSETDLLESDGPLELQMDYPSPGSLSYLEGKIRWVGKPLDAGLWVYANSTDNKYHSGFFVERGETEFRIGPTPPGIYTISCDHPDVENMNQRGIAGLSNLKNVKVPSKDRLQIALRTKLRPQLIGTVVDAETGKPLPLFRLRVTKLRTLSGPNYVQEDGWKTFTNAGGNYSVEVASPGVYVVSAMAQGYAITSTEQVNTDEAVDSQRLELRPGVSLVGKVTDAAGAPVDGAVVQALSYSAGSMPRVLNHFVVLERAVKTTNGQFELAHMTPGIDSLQVTHPDFVTTVVQNITITDTPDESVDIQLESGATIRGVVYDSAGQPQPGVTLFVQDDYAYGGGDLEAGRLAQTITDDEGRYEVKHVPNQIVYVNRADQWNSLGVVRRTIQTNANEDFKLDFGGPQQLRGIVKLSGAALANTKLQLAGENPTFGIMQMRVQTSENGAFTFHGPPPGHWTLYYQIPGTRSEWGALTSVDIPPDGDVDLEIIDHRICNLHVDCAADDPELRADFNFRLQEYDPRWTHGRSVGMLRSRQSTTDEFVIAGVPSGEYELVCIRQSDYLMARQRITVDATQPQQSIPFQLPVGKSRLFGTVAKELFEPNTFRSLNLWSEDSRILTQLRPKEDDTYEIANLPAGKYVIRAKDTRDAGINATLALRANDNKEFNLNLDNFTRDKLRIGFASVRCLGPQGSLIPVQARIRKGNETITPSSTQNANSTFIAPPGDYELEIQHPGFKPVEIPIEIKPVNDHGGPAADYQHDLTLERL